MWYGEGNMLNQPQCRRLKHLCYQNGLEFATQDKIHLKQNVILINLLDIKQDFKSNTDNVHKTKIFMVQSKFTPLLY